jgi:hypothetical protein
VSVKDNTGAITIRCPGKRDGAAARADYMKAKDLALKEFERNKASGEGPTTFSELFREMAQQRYANERATEKADDARVIAERRGEQSPPAPSALELI